MSKFCPNCGTTVDDATIFCSACGTKIEAAPAPAAPAYEAPAYQQPTYEAPAYQQPAYQAPVQQQPAYQDPYQVNATYTQPPQYTPEAKKKPIGLFIGLGAATLALLTIFMFFLLRVPYGSALKNYMNALYMYEPSNVEDLMPEEAWIDLEDWCNEDVYDYEIYFDDYHDGHIEDLEEYYGYDFKFSYKIDRKSRVSDSKLNRIAGDLEDYYYIDADSITKAYELTVTYTYDGEYDYEEETVHLLAIKIDGQWYIMEDYDDGDYEFIFW